MQSLGCNSPLGIGRATAHQFAHNGARAVFICDFANEHLETHKREMNILYPEADIHPRHFDAADEDGVKGVVDEAIQRYGRLDVFFANAAVSGTWKTVFDTSVEEWERTLRTNLTRYVPFLACAKSSGYFD
jgi:NAD(P)-dependent dehydrogenase (short-subunit alcohol dehydrogenase family)